MKNKNIIIGIISAIVILGLVFVIMPPTSKKSIKKVATASKEVIAMQKGAKNAYQAPAKAPAKKAIAKDKGGLTVRIVDSKTREVNTRLKAFKSADGKTSVYEASFSANTMQELTPGTYDIEIETNPPEIYKNIRVNQTEEKMVDLGAITGALNVKAVNSQKKDASYPVRVLRNNSQIAVYSITTNKLGELLPGVYDIEIGMIPKQIKKDVKIEAGKEAALDLGCMTGALVVKCVDTNNKEVMCSVSIINPSNKVIVGSGTANRPIEIVNGIYNVELMSAQRQTKNGVKVNAGEESSVEFTVQAAAPKTVNQAPPKEKK